MDKRAKIFLPKIKWNLMACHTPSLKKAKKQGECHHQASVNAEFSDGMGVRMGNVSNCA